MLTLVLATLIEAELAAMLLTTTSLLRLLPEMETVFATPPLAPWALMVTWPLPELVRLPTVRLLT